MIALLQRVLESSVKVDDQTTGSIGKGLLLLVCAQKGDTAANAKALAQKVLKFRVFEDKAGKMNLSALDTNSGNRASFTPAAEPALAKALYDLFTDEVRASGLKTETGIFGADMKVSLVNDGPVTFWLQIPKNK